jgi:predicted transcriptional regulator
VSDLTDRILYILGGSPSGLTAGEVAKRMDRTVGNISSRLSKLAAYGVINKTRGRTAHDAPLCSIYKAPISKGRTNRRSGVRH